MEISEPTDPRIAETDLCGLAELLHEMRCAVTLNRVDDYGCRNPGATIMAADWRCPVCAAWEAISLLQQRLEQQNSQIGELLQSVNARTSERDQAREAIKVQETFYEQRLEQVTSELAHWKDCHGVTADRLEAAEATIASLRDALTRIVQLNTRRGDANIAQATTMAALAFVEAFRVAKAALASLPSSAVSRTAERQP